MTVKETIMDAFRGYNVYKLNIDRGKESTVYKVFMDNPLGRNTGKIVLEWALASRNKIDAAHIARLMRRQVDVDIDSLVK